MKMEHLKYAKQSVRNFVGTKLSLSLSTHLRTILGGQYHTYSNFNGQSSVK